MKQMLLFISLTLLAMSASAQRKILFVTSNQSFYGSTKIPASNHFEEIVVPYHLFSQAGFEVDFISPKGGAIPVGYINTSDSLQKRYLYDGFFMDKLEHTAPPQQIVAENYAAIYYSGGGAAMYGVAEDTNIQKIAGKIFSRNGILSAICHGTAGLAYLKNEKGTSLIAGKKITGYPDYFENKKMEYYKAFPFNMDKAIKNNEGLFVYSKKEKDSFFVADGRVVTGQDPSSASNVAQKIISLLNHGNKMNDKQPVQNDRDQIVEILTDYIDGTANGEPERLRKAFHSQFNLYTIAKDTLWTRSGEQYINNVKPGEKVNRIGKIISIDIEKDAAIAKGEILVPGWRLFTDYFLLLKIQGKWKIIHKSYSWRDMPKTEMK